MIGLMLYVNLKGTCEAIQADHIGAMVRKTFKKGIPEEYKNPPPEVSPFQDTMNV